LTDYDEFRKSPKIHEFLRILVAQIDRPNSRSTWPRVKSAMQLYNAVDNVAVKLNARQVKDTQIQLFPLFHDFDPTNNGAVTRNQFRWVLDVLKLAPYALTETEWICMWDKYQALKGYRQDVNYIDFCDAIYDLAGYPYRSP